MKSSSRAWCRRCFNDGRLRRCVWSFKLIARRNLLAWALAGAFVPSVASARSGFEVLSPESGGVYADLLSQLERSAKPFGLHFNVTAKAEPSDIVPPLVITLGVRALREAVQRAIQSPAWAQVPVLAAMLPQSAWRSVSTGLPKGSSAIWLDQPVDRYVELSRQALSQRRRLGVLLGPTSMSLEPLLDRAVAARGMSVVKANIDDPANELFPALQGILQKCDMLVALPDPALYNAESLQNILIATYRQRVPMLSYSAAHARAGATLALHTPVEDVAAQLVKALRQFATQGVLPAPDGPQGFSVSVNEQVARSLSLVLRSPGELQAAVLRAEGQLR